MFKLNFKIAVRNLWKHKAYTLINIGGLAIGLASCMILLLYVSYEWGYDKQTEGYENTYVIYNNQKSSGRIATFPVTPVAIAKAVKTTIPGVKYSTHASFPEDKLISYGSHVFKKQAMFAEPDLIRLFKYKLIKGNPDQVLQQVNTVILTATMAKNLFGREEPINKIVKLDNQEPLKVEAVIADLPKNSSVQFDYLLPWRLFERLSPNQGPNDWRNNYCQTFVQLEDLKYFDKANQLVNQIYKKNTGEEISEFMLYPLSRWHLYDRFENGKAIGGKIEQLRLFFILAFCLLLIACVNFMNLSTARSEKRAKEVGVRKVIGSSRQSLIVQFMLESVLLALLAMVIAFVLIEVSLPYFNGLLKTELTINYQEWKFWTSLFLLTLITGVIAGSYPALYLSSFEPARVLKNFRTAKISSLPVRQVLVVFQFVFAACLIIFTVVIYQQLNFIKNKPIGYNKNNLVEISVEGLLKKPERLAFVKQRLLKSGAVATLSTFSSSLVEGGCNTTDINWDGKDIRDHIFFNYRSAGADFVKTMGGTLSSGREFSGSSADSLNVIVNETAVKIMELKNPVGAVIRFGEIPVKIIGVMKDFVMESPYKTPAPMILYHQPNDVRFMVLRLNPAENVSTAMQKIEEIVKQANPDFPVESRFADDNFETKFQNEKLLGTAANLFGGFAIVISCLGLLGLALYMAEQRKKEIGIRKVLGASNWSVLTLLNREFIKLVVIANLIAFPLAYFLANHWLSGYSFRVNVSVFPFALALGLSLLIAILTVSIQSVKVVKANPADALKYE